MTSQTDTSTQKLLNNVYSVDTDVYDDFAGEHAMVLYYRMCNFKCIYCHNKELWSASSKDCKPASYFIDKHNDGLHTAVVFSGGEATIHPVWKDIKYAKELGLKTKLFTNWARPSEIAKCLPYLDAISLDIKFLTNSEIVGVYVNPETYKYSLYNVLTNIANAKNKIYVDLRILEWKSISDKERSDLRDYLQYMALSFKNKLSITTYIQEERA